MRLGNVVSPDALEDAMSAQTLPELPARAFDKQDPGPDLDFYAPPRLVTHIDERAVAALTARYRELLRPGGEVVGHGMNAAELSANPRLTRRFVQDLNADPVLPLADASFDAALCCVGVQYLQRPVEVFAEVRRTLRPGGTFAVSYSNRCFPTKAVAIWRALDMGGQARLITLYLERAGFAAVDTRVLADGARGDPLVVVTGTTG